MTSYSLDPQSARKADTHGAMITELGKYIGTFIQAEDVTASTGTKGLSLRFVSDAGQKANLSIYTEKADGTPLSGRDAVSAMLTCMSLRGIESKPGKVKVWDAEAKQEVEKQANVFPDLCNKPIGVLLETEDYLKRDGGTGTKLVLKGVFQAKTELTASEILDRKTQPEQLPRFVASLRHRPLKNAPAQRTHSAPAAQGGFADMDDDIPFRDPLAYRGTHLVF